MRILFLDPVGTLGGAERSLLDLMASLRAAAPEVSLALLVAAGGPLVDEARALGVEVRVLPMPASLASLGDSALASGAASRGLVLARGGAGAARYALALRREVAAMAPTVVHSNGMKMHFLTAALPRKLPVVWHLRDIIGERRAARALRVIAPRVRGFLCISRAVADDARRVLGREDVTVLYNAIDVARFTPQGDAVDLDHLAGLPPAPADVVRVGLVATYAKWKGQTLFLDAAERIAGAHPNARFYVIGGPTYATEGSQLTREELTAIVASKGLASRVGLVPFVDRPERAFRALDVAVHASTRPEPFGRTIVEAMACGRAVVVAAEGGAAELVDHDVDALTVPPRDVGALASAIARLAGDPALRARIGARARETAVAKFSRDRLGPAALSMYRAIARD